MAVDRPDIKCISRIAVIEFHLMNIERERENAGIQIFSNVSKKYLWNVLSFFFFLLQYHFIAVYWNTAGGINASYKYLMEINTYAKYHRGYGIATRIRGTTNRIY